MEVENKKPESPAWPFFCGLLMGCILALFVAGGLAEGYKFADRMKQEAIHEAWRKSSDDAAGLRSEMYSLRNNDTKREESIRYLEIRVRSLQEFEKRLDKEVDRIYERMHKLDPSDQPPEAPDVDAPKPTPLPSSIKGKPKAEPKEV